MVQINVKYLLGIPILGFLSFLSGMENTHSIDIEEAYNKAQELSEIKTYMDNGFRYIDGVLHQDDKKSIYKWREIHSKKLQEELRSIFLLHLDTETFARCVEQIKVYSDGINCEKKSPAVLLHMWSYLTGIPIVGLKEHQKYYLDNHHLVHKCFAEEEIPQGAITSPVSIGTHGADIRVYLGQKTGEKILNLWADLLLSVAVFRAPNTMHSPKNLSEHPRIIWEFLDKELAPLEQINQDILSILLDVLLKLPLGVVKLFQNTALYLSNTVESGVTFFASPCTIRTISGLGLQDGIFIGRSKGLKDTILRAFGMHFYYRAFHKSCPDEDGSLCYVPHYALLDNEGGEIIHKAAMDECAKKFALIIQNLLGADSVANDTLGTVLNSSLENLKKQQLNEKLVTKECLEKKVGKVIVDSHCHAADLSGPAMKQEVGGVIGDDDLGAIPVTSILHHFRCIEYQDLCEVDLSDNFITSGGAKCIADCCAENVLPLLRKLNLSNNRIDKTAVPSFKYLLGRHTFQFLDLSINGLGELTENDIESVYGISSGDLLAKIIVTPFIYVDALLAANKMTQQSADAHREYYNKHL